MNKFTLFLFILCIFTLGAKAQTTVQIGDLYYTLDDASLTAETAAMPLADDGSQPRYTFSTVTVPATVDYNGNTYNVVKIGDGSLRELPNLTQITIPASVTDIGNSAFAQCPNLITVLGSQYASVVEDWAFYSCPKLAFFLFSPNLKVISAHCFQQCSSLTNVTIPEGVTSIKVCAFQTCSNLKTVTLPSTLTEIVNWSFDGTAVQSFKIPEGVTSIAGGWTFSNNSALTTLTLPASLTQLDDWTFDNCPNIKSIYISWPTPPDTNDPTAAIQGIKWWGFGNKIGSNTTSDGSEDRSVCTAYVPAQYADAYGTTWLGFTVQSMTGIPNIATETAHAYYTDGTLNLINLDGYTVSVYSANGQLAATFKADKSSVQLPLTPGVYILRATYGQVAKTVKFIAK